MFIRNGIVYGGEPETCIRIEGVKVLADKIMLITFSSGETRLFDASVLEGEVYKKLDDEEVFRNAAIDHGVVTWSEGEIDCAPEFMYEHSYEYSVAV